MFLLPLLLALILGMVYMAQCLILSPLMLFQGIHPPTWVSLLGIAIVLAWMLGDR